MTFLADSNIICEQTKSQASPKALEWLKAHSDEVVIDAVVLGEIWDGIAALPDGRKRRDLEGWFARLRRSTECLPWTADTAVVWGGLRQDVRRRGFTVAIKDTMIAATAKLHGLTVATRNVDDFTRCGVPVVNPFEWFPAPVSRADKRD
jgi:predicted nucleic acid-binding protein